MSMVAFTKNHADHSNQQGFQFEFFCDKCGSGWRSPFKPNKLGFAAGILGAASSLFGGLSSAANAGRQMNDLLRGKAWDEAFAETAEEGKQHFKQCKRCAIWVCPEVCWNQARGQCQNCSPDLAEESAAAQAQAAKNQVWEKARLTDQTEGANMAKAVKVCPSCNAKVEAGTFCPECGKPMEQPKTEFCADCGAKMAPKAKFCPDCGKPRG
jgi:hypothetical protein